MAFTQVSGARALLLGIGGFVGIVAAWVGYADLARNFLPADLRVYWPLLMIAGFACALWAVGTIDDKVDGVIYRENIAHRRRIETLEAQLAQSQPRDIAREKRGRIAQRIEAGVLALKPGVKYQTFWPVTIYALSNAADTAHLARAIHSVLQFSFAPEIEEDDYSQMYSAEDWRGIVLFEPPRIVSEGHNLYASEERRSKAAQLIVDAFCAEGVEVTRSETRYRTTKITILVGARV